MEPTPATSPAPAIRPWFFWALGAVTVAFGAVRFAGAGNDLWMDEIWSLGFISQLHAPAEILTRFLHDNNHPLYSLWLYALGPGHAAWVYRLLACVTGTVTVALAGLIGRRQFQLLHAAAAPARAATAGLLTATVVGGAYLLVHYSSEARGYGPAVMFGFLAMYALTFASGRPASGWAVVYGFACALGLLAHMVAFQVLLAGAAWSALVVFKNWNNWRDRWVHLACWHLGPGLFFGAYYFGFARMVDRGGGPTIPLAELLRTLSVFTLGLPRGTNAAGAMELFLGVTLAGWFLIWRRDRALAVFYFTGIFLAPAAGIYSSGYAVLFPRYFIMSGALAVLLGGYALARLWTASRTGRLLAGVLLGAFLVGNGVHVARLLRDGRGQYQAALRYIGEHTPAGPITVSSDSDFRNFIVMEYYKAAVGPDHQLQYFPGGRPVPGGVQWVFFHRLDESTPVPPETLHDPEGHNYQLVRVFPHAPLSGWEWYVYRNLDPNLLPPTGS